MSQITEENVHELLNSLEGDLSNDCDAFSESSASTPSAVDDCDSMEVGMEPAFSGPETVDFDTLPPGLKLVSFLCLLESELQEAVNMPIAGPAEDLEDSRSMTEAGDSVDDGGGYDYISESAMEVDDDNALAAAADVMSLHPPFCPSSTSDSSDDDDELTFANEGWGTDETRRGWVPVRPGSLVLPTHCTELDTGCEEELCLIEYVIQYMKARLD